jgi:hypothetical protein
MGFLKVRQVRGEQKIYWCVRKRQSKKLGGSGKVLSIEYYLGDSWYSLKNLSWYVWENSINLSEFLEKFISYYLNDLGISNINFWLKDNQVYFRSNSKDIDLRCKDIKFWLNSIRFIVNSIKDDSNNFNKDIQSVIKKINLANESIDIANRYKKKMINNRELIDNYNYWCNIINSLDDRIQLNLEKIIKNYVPKTQHDYAKKKICSYCLSKCPLKQLDL